MNNIMTSLLILSGNIDPNTNYYNIKIKLKVKHLCKYTIKYKLYTYVKYFIYI